MSKPIPDPHANQVYVSIGFRWTGHHFSADEVRTLYETVIGRTVWVEELSVGVRVISAGGEKAEDEGRYDAPRGLRLDDTEVVADIRPTDTVKVKGLL